MADADFPVGEFETRLERVQEAMRSDGLDAILFTSEAEMRYFTGFRTLFWQSPTRPWFLILPKTGKPIAIIPEIGAALMASTWIDDIRTWASPHEDDDGRSLLLAALQGMAKVGLPMGRESQLRLPLNDFNQLLQHLPGTEFIDASALMQNIRMTKSETEIQKISAICQIASASFANASTLFFAGRPLDEAFRAFKVELLKQGAEEVPYLVGGAGQGGYGDIISPPGNAPLLVGDVMMLDTGATLAGYFCDFDRNYAIGSAGDAARTAYETLYAATEAALAAARPGIKACELYQVMAKFIAQTGDTVGRFGHGLGIQLTEPPSLISFDQTVLRAGMVITLEPSMQIGPNKIMVHEENIVIRDGAPELLSLRAPSELPII